VKQGYRFTDHTADFGLEIFGTDAGDLFVQAAKALSDLITDPKILQNRHRRSLTVDGDDWADLMVNWLRELLYLWNGEAQLVSHVVIETLAQKRLVARVATDDYNPGIHPIRNEIKAITYHRIQVGPYRTGWRARVIFDV
jgi:SHS2 domain-containing protein